MSSDFDDVCIVCEWQGDSARFIEAEVGGVSVELPWRDRADGLKEMVIARRLRPEVTDEAQDAIDNILNRLDQWGKAYPTDMFREITDEDREWLHRERPGLMDRIAASMGRHMHNMIAKDIATLTAALEGSQK